MKHVRFRHWLLKLYIDAVYDWNFVGIVENAYAVGALLKPYAHGGLFRHVCSGRPYLG